MIPVSLFSRSSQSRLADQCKEALDQDTKWIYSGWRSFGELEVRYLYYDEVRDQIGWKHGVKIQSGEVYAKVQQLAEDNGSDLPLRLDLHNHSPDGFEVGYAGSGPSQLALAICAHYCDDELAQMIYTNFRDAVIRDLDDPFVIWDTAVRGVIETFLIRLRRPYQHDLFDYLNASAAFESAEKSLDAKL